MRGNSSRRAAYRPRWRPLPPRRGLRAQPATGRLASSRWHKARPARLSVPVPLCPTQAAGELLARSTRWSSRAAAERAGKAKDRRRPASTRRRASFVVDSWRRPHSPGGVDGEVRGEVRGSVRPSTPAHTPEPAVHDGLRIAAHERLDLLHPPRQLRDDEEVLAHACPAGARHRLGLLREGQDPQQAIGDRLRVRGVVDEQPVGSVPHLRGEASHVRGDDRRALPERLAQVSPKPSLSEFCTTAAAMRCSAFTASAFCFAFAIGRRTR